MIKFLSDMTLICSGHASLVRETHLPIEVPMIIKCNGSGVTEPEPGYKTDQIFGSNDYIEWLYFKLWL